ncbi:MAG: SWIM zinc finger family protein [Nanoarchaeota archaeon]
MNIKKRGNFYYVESSTKGKYYKVSLKNNTCDCPHFQFRLKKQGGACKHLKAVKELYNTNAKDDFQKAVDYVKNKGEVDSIDFIEIFSEGILEELIERGELVEKNGKINLLT